MSASKPFNSYFLSRFVDANGASAVVTGKRATGNEATRFEPHGLRPLHFIIRVGNGYTVVALRPGKRPLRPFCSPCLGLSLPFMPRLGSKGAATMAGANRVLLRPGSRSAATADAM